jgi:hypothetical protein
MSAATTIFKKGGTYGVGLARSGGNGQAGQTLNGSSPGAVHNAAPGKANRRGRPKIYASDAERQTARRVRRYAAGLNSQGRTYQRHPNFVSPFETPLCRQQQQSARRAAKLKSNLASYRRLAALNRAAGLRVDGQPFRRHVRFHAWKNFRARLATAPVGNWEVVERI